MSISFQNYVDIISGIAGDGPVRARQLITRVFSQNPLIPTNSYAEFTNADDVGDYFGATSLEYQYAAFYFGFVSKTATSPQLISFASFVATNRAPTVFGDSMQTDSLTMLQHISSGKLNLQLGATTMLVSGINLSAVTSMAGAATALQAAIQAAVPGDPVWATATVTFNALTGAFQLLGGGNTGAGTIAILSGPSQATDLGIAFGWESPAAIVSQGQAAMSLTATLIASVGASNNFASFVFLPDTLTVAQNTEIAIWNASQNVEYLFLCPVDPSDAGANSAALLGYAGSGLVLSPDNINFPELLPGAIGAAIDYDNPNASTNFMFQTAPLPVTVQDDVDQAAYDALRVNYYGQTQQAGQTIKFFQRGVMMGGPTAPTDMNVFFNEIWFKGAMGTVFMSALLALPEIPANKAGRATLLAISQPVIEKALLNGTISVGNPLSGVQKVSIQSITGDTGAAAQVATIGYWIDFSFTQIVTVDGRTEYQANYTLVYTKNNAIRKIVGSHNLI